MEKLTPEQVATLSPEEIAVAGETRKPYVLGICTTFLILAALVALARFYVRFKILRKFGNDDWATLVASVALAAMSSTLIGKTAHGGGIHIFLVSDEDVDIYMKMSTAHIVLYQFAFCMIKIAFLFQYARVFPLPNFQRICYVGMILVSMFAISQIILAVVPCLPYAKLINPEVDGVCINKTIFWYVNSIVHTVTDFAIMLMPMPMVRMLPLQLPQKLLLMAVFGLGIFVSAISIIRTTFLIRATASDDYTYDTIPTAIWSVVETSCAMICLCAPTLRPLYRLIKGTPSSGSNAKNGDNQNIRRMNHRFPESYRDIEWGAKLPAVIGIPQRKFSLDTIMASYPDESDSEGSKKRRDRSGGNSSPGGASSTGEMIYIDRELAGTREHQLEVAQIGEGNSTFWFGEDNDSDTDDARRSRAVQGLRPPDRALVGGRHERISSKDVGIAI